MKQPCGMLPTLFSGPGILFPQKTINEKTVLFTCILARMSPPPNG